MHTITPLSAHYHITVCTLSHHCINYYYHYYYYYYYYNYYYHNYYYYHFINIIIIIIILLLFYHFINIIIIVILLLLLSSSLLLFYYYFIIIIIISNRCFWCILWLEISSSFFSSEFQEIDTKKRKEKNQIIKNSFLFIYLHFFKFIFITL